MPKLASKPRHGTELLVNFLGKTRLSVAYQRYFDDLEQLINDNLLGQQVQLPEYLVAELPDASVKKGGMIYVSDASGGPVVAFTDGINWRRCTDRTVVT